MSAPSQTGGQPTIHTFVNQTPVVSSTAPSLGQAAIVSNHVSIDLSAASDTGTSSSDHVTADNTPDITGHTDVPFSHVIIYEGHQKVGSGFSDVNGNYKVTVSSLGDGVHTLTASATTLSSSQASTSSPLSLNIDTSLAKPSIDLQASTDSGVSDHDDLTKHHNPIFTGHTDANAQVEIIDSHGKVLAHGSADSHGDYQLTVTSIPEGRQTLSVIATDLAGNTSRSDLSLEVDYTAPTITNVNLSDVSTHQVLFAGKVSPDTDQVNIVVKQGSHVVESCTQPWMVMAAIASMLPIFPMAIIRRLSKRPIMQEIALRWDIRDDLIDLVSTQWQHRLVLLSHTTLVSQAITLLAMVP